jgi:alkylhydroperoxidase family enzyme
VAEGLAEPTALVASAEAGSDTCADVDSELLGDTSVADEAAPTDANRESLRRTAALTDDSKPLFTSAVR